MTGDEQLRTLIGIASVLHLPAASKAEPKSPKAGN
jgi:hypothetical protein